jgi:HlyD family secretion protein
VRVRALVDETDIGKMKAELAVTVSVAAHPGRRFEGRVLKIEPQAVIEQNVTTFPVLVRVESPEGMLKPGMNCEVEIHINRREDVLTIPNAALRTWSDLGTAARVIGLSEDAVRQSLDQGRAAGGARRTPGEYVVFIDRAAGPAARWVRTGLTDLDYSEVLSGLEANDAVFVLPSAGLVRSQEQRRDRLERVTGGGLPGLRSRSR